MRFCSTKRLEGDWLSSPFSNIRNNKASYIKFFACRCASLSCYNLKKFYCFRNLRKFTSMSNVTASMVHDVQLPLQKLLFSATMTQNPEKLAQLKLYKPILFTSVKEENNHADLKGKGLELFLIAFQVILLYFQHGCIDLANSCCYISWNFKHSLQFLTCI